MAATKVSGVTPENWGHLASSFITLNGGRGFVIVRDRIKATSEHPICLRNFGAWMGYFRARRIPCAAIENIGRATVPCAWPHEFDADWGVGNDDQAGDMFESSWRRRNDAWKAQTAEGKAKAAEEAKAQAAQPTLLAQLEGL